MIFFNVFLTSIKLPKKEAMFRLNRVGMDIAVIYMFILLAIISIPALIERLTTTEGLGADINIIFKLIYFFMFYYLPMSLIIFISLSVVAYIGRGITYVLKRKLRFSILWKMVAFTTTVPFLLYTILALLFPISDTYLLLAIIYSLLLLIKMITIYPKRRERTS